MAENIQRNRGRGSAYKYDKGGVPSEFGPFIGIVKSAIDSTRAGRLRVYIESFGGEDPEDEANWRTVQYLPPFYGATEHVGGQGTGEFVGNRHTYGMWFTPPDVGTKVLCFFADGDPNNGYYVGCVPDPRMGHMVPAIAGSGKYNKDSYQATNFYNNVGSLPVTEINGEDPAVFEDARFWDRAKPIHVSHAFTLFQQGLIKDPIRGPITSSSQRESPSAVFGVSTPGRPIYSGGQYDEQLKTSLTKNTVTPDQVKVIGRQGGHTFVMDDGDLEGNNKLVRIRTSKGHQITMSDDGDAFYITHANGLSWIELGKEGTVDVYSSNSVNVRTQGSINLHADADINMFAGRNLNINAEQSVNLESNLVNLRAEAQLKAYSKQAVMIRSDQTLALDAGKAGSFDGGSNLVLKASCVAINSGGGIPVTAVPEMPKNKVTDSRFNGSEWISEASKLKTIATRVPTHEPWPFHGYGIQNSVDLGGVIATPPPTVTEGVLQTVADVTPNGISLADFSATERANYGVESLNSDQTTGIMAQLAKDTEQRYNIFSTNKGIGKYGLDPTQLEQAGYLVPGTSDRLLVDPFSTVTDAYGNQRTKMEDVLTNTQCWTNKGGVTDLSELLNNVELQDKVVQDVFTDVTVQLKNAGVINGTESPRDIGALINPAVQQGTSNVIRWSQDKDIPSDVKDKIVQASRNGQYAVDFVDEKLAENAGGFGSPGGYAGTTDRTGVNQAQNLILGSNSGKIPPQDYS